MWVKATATLRVWNLTECKTMAAITLPFSKFYSLKSFCRISYKHSDSICEFLWSGNMALFLVEPGFGIKNFVICLPEICVINLCLVRLTSNFPEQSKVYKNILPSIWYVCTFYLRNLSNNLINRVEKQIFEWRSFWKRSAVNMPNVMMIGLRVCVNVAEYFKTNIVINLTLD